MNPFAQYANKSPAIQAKYFEIRDWKQAGLDKLSYADTGKIIDLPATAVEPTPIGKLSENDKRRLMAFLENQ